MEITLLLLIAFCGSPARIREDISAPKLLHKNFS
jgi:hypothetical protein